MPLRRDEISKKVLGSQRGAFKAVFQEAQIILSNTFGMELVELPTRAAAHDATAGQDRSQDKAGTQNGEHPGERQMVTGLKKKGACHSHFFFFLSVGLMVDGPRSRLAGLKDIHPQVDTGPRAH